MEMMKLVDEPIIVNEEKKTDEMKKRATRKPVVRKALNYKIINDMINDMDNAKEPAPEEIEISGKVKILKALKKGILSMLKKGYSVKATANFINAKVSPYVVSEVEIRKLLSKVTLRKKVSKTKNISSVKKANEEEDVSPVSADSSPPVSANAPEKTEAKDNTKVAIPKVILEEERIYLTTTVDEKDEAKALGAKYEGTRKQWYIWKGLDPKEIERFRKWLP
jgi:hypothetical protein